MFGQKKDAAYWRKQVKDLIVDFLDDATAAEAVALFDNPKRADQIVDAYRYFEEDEDPAELAWPIFCHFMEERKRIAMVDWSLDSRGWMNVFNRTLNDLQLAPISDAEAGEIVARSTRGDIRDTIVRLQGELSAVVEKRGFALMLDSGGQDAHVHYLAPPEAARRWDFKTIGRDMQLTIIAPRKS